MSNYSNLEQIMHLANTLWPEFYQKHKGELAGKTGLYLLVFERQTSLLLGGVCGRFEDEKKGSVLHKKLEQKTREKSLIP